MGVDNWLFSIRGGGDVSHILPSLERDQEFFEERITRKNFSRYGLWTLLHFQRGLLKNRVSDTNLALLMT